MPTRELSGALERLAATPTEAHLEAARNAWRTARQSWETTESWAFGPAGTGGFDGNLDEWPANEKDLGMALAGGALTPATYAKLTSTARGFHGVEFVLFGQGPVQPPVGQLKAAQRSYLRHAGADLAANTGGLLAAWQGPGGYGVSGASGSSTGSIPPPPSCTMVAPAPWRRRSCGTAARPPIPAIATWPCHGRNGTSCWPGSASSEC
jgi:predicted lipoprotein